MDGGAVETGRGRCADRDCKCRKCPQEVTFGKAGRKSVKGLGEGCKSV